MVENYVIQCYINYEPPLQAMSRMFQGVVLECFIIPGEVTLGDDEKHTSVNFCKSIRADQRKVKKVE